MKQIIQPLSGGPAQVVEVPLPVPDATEVLVRTVASVISAGTERSATALIQDNLLAADQGRPDLLRQMASTTRAGGAAVTRRAVRSRPDTDLPLGYSAAGVVVETGPAVTGIRPGQLVATGGAGKASHAEFQVVPALLCVPVPQAVAADDAAFTALASVAQHGFRLAGAGPGSKVVVLGLGLTGQLAARLAAAAGCDVLGIDPAGHARAAARQAGVTAADEDGEATTGQVLDWTRGRGADAVLVCASGASSGVMQRTPALCRDRAAVVIISDVGLQLDRAAFGRRELTVRFAGSCGPGRHELAYESWAVDYPAGQVRWTEGRNFEAVLDLLAARRLRVDDLVTHTFDLAGAAAAYQLIESRAEPHLAVLLRYPEPPGPASLDGTGPRRAPLGAAPVPPDPPPAAAAPWAGLVGAGAFATGTLVPALRAAGFTRWAAVGSAGGLSARRAAQRHGFAAAVSGASGVLADPAVAMLVIATRHDSHAALAARGLATGRHVWCEKPLALTEDELDAVEAAWRASGRQLAVGFNRRWSPAVLAARAALAQAPGPRLLVYRVCAGPVPAGHWYRDRRQGGRLLGEVCHFIDTAQALIGAPAEDVAALGGGPGGADAAVSLSFADGSLATIGYGSAAPGRSKERIEVHAGREHLVIDDFRSVTAGGATLWKGRADTGHRGLADAFYRAVTGGPPLPTAELLATMRVTVRAAALAGRRG